MRAVTESSRRISLVFLVILSFSLPFSLAFDLSAWSHRHMFKRAYGVDNPLAAVAKVHPSPVSPSALTPILSIPSILPSDPLQPLTTPAPLTPTLPTSSPSIAPPSPSPQTTSTVDILTTSTTPSSTSSSTTYSPTTSSTTSSVVQTSSTPTPIIEQASPTAVPTTLIAAPSYAPSPDAFTSGLPTPSSTPTQSSSGFFSNTGAVAGTFTVIGLFGIAGIIGIGMLLVRRRNSRRPDEDMEYLDKTPDLLMDPSMTETRGVEDDSMTEDHYGASPMVVASPPNAYYPDHGYPTHPWGHPADAYAPQPYMQGYPTGYATQHIYRPEDYNIAYPPAAHPDSSMPNPHSFADVELGSTPVLSTQEKTNAVPDALRPAVQSTSISPQQRVDTRFSVDSFYTGMVTEKSSPITGLAL